MEIKWITDLLDKWISLTDKKKLSYITGAIMLVAGLIIWFGYTHYENKITELNNERIKDRNECTISLNSTIARYESALTVEREKAQTALESHIKYVEKNEEQVRDILFYTKKYKKVSK